MSDQYVGEIRMFGGNYAPEGWLPCDGRLLSISEYDVLYTLIGTTYGGDGVSTFAVPDLRGRVPINDGQGPGLSYYAIGQAGGVNEVSLTSAEYPSHVHVAQASKATGAQPTSEGGLPAASSSIALYKADVPGATLNGAAVGMSQGGAQPHENRQPFLAVNFIIAHDGFFPPHS